MTSEELAVSRALALLRQARDLLRHETAARKTLARVRLAISSAKGAQRTALYRANRGD